MFIIYFAALYMLFKTFALKNQNLVVHITLASVHEIFTLLKPSVYFMCHLVQHLIIRHSAHTVH
jgi:hypothetical protein